MCKTAKWKMMAGFQQSCYFTVATVAANFRSSIAAFNGALIIRTMEAKNRAVDALSCWELRRVRIVGKIHGCNI